MQFARTDARRFFLCLAPLTIVGCGTPFRAQESVSLVSPCPTSRLIVNNSVGQVSIYADPAATQLRAEIIKIGRGASQEQANQALEDMEVELSAKDTEPGVVRAEARHPGGNGLRN